MYNEGVLGSVCNVLLFSATVFFSPLFCTQIVLVFDIFTCFFIMHLFIILQTFNVNILPEIIMNFSLPRYYCN